MVGLIYYITFSVIMISGGSAIGLIAVNLFALMTLIIGDK